MRPLGYNRQEANASHPTPTVRSRMQLTQRGLRAIVRLASAQGPQQHPIMPFYYRCRKFSPNIGSLNFFSEASQALQFTLSASNRICCAA